MKGMKRLRFLVLFSFLFVFSVTACSGGGEGGAQGAAPVVCSPVSVANGTVDASTCKITCNAGFALNGATCVALPRIKREGFKPIPEAEYAEQIVFAMNESFAQTHLDWQTRAQGIVNHINVVMNRNANNRKSYSIGRFMTYPDADIKEMAQGEIREAFFLDNNFTGNSNGAGTTIFMLMVDNSVDLAGIFLDGLGNSFEQDIYKSVGGQPGKKFATAWIADQMNDSLFTDVNPELKNFYPDWYDLKVGVFVHEAVGHGLGLAGEDQYNYNFTDQTGVLPDLGSYTLGLTDAYLGDPMTGGYGPAILWKFADFNAWVIDKNANHQYSAQEVMYGIPAEIRVRVVNSQGAAISGATVTTFGALDTKKTTKYEMRVLLETLTTDVNGEVVIKNDFPDIWLAKGIKAAYGNKYAGQYLILTDLEIAYLQQGLERYLITLTLP